MAQKLYQDWSRGLHKPDQAVRVIGEKEKALYWLGEPKRRFEGRTPIQMLRTDLGGRMVEEMLGQIYYGMFASG
jgi:uncharacterized protein (DUF2384 family)